MAYKVIHDTFWTDPTLKKLSFTARGLLSYFITNAQSHYSGIYYLPLSLIREETDLTARMLTKFMDELKGLKRIQYDYTQSIIWVVNMCRHQLKHQGKKANLITGIGNHLQSLHQNRLIKDFLEYYQDLNIPFAMPSEWHGDGIAESVTVSVTVTGAVEEEGCHENGLTPQMLFEGWNDILRPEGFSGMMTLTKERIDKVSKRIKEYPDPDYWAKVLRKMPRCQFFFENGKVKPWVTFDWLIKNDHNHIKILEGKYDKTGESRKY